MSHVQPDLPIGPPPPPPPSILVEPAATSVALTSGQHVTGEYLLSRHLVTSPVTLGTGPLPPGITAAFSPPVLSAATPDQPFSLTLTAAPDVTPVTAAVRVTATSGFKAAHSTASIDAKAAGSVLPSYLILTVVYAPPGTDGGKSASQVLYADGSSTGTKVAVSSSFKEGVDVAADASLNIGVFKAGASGDFTASQTTGDTASMSVDKSLKTQLTVPGPPKDGIDHGWDRFYLLLNPLLNATLDSQGHVAWGMGDNGTETQPVWVYASELENPATMREPVAAAFAAAGLTTADYARILAADPFTSGVAAIDPNRFVLLSQQGMTYEPPLTANDTVGTTTLTLTADATASSEQQVQNQYGVSASVSGGLNIAVFQASVKVTGSLQWTNTSTTTLEAGTTQTATATVGGPAFGYTGPIDVLLYWDTLYRSFMFAFPPGPPAASGTLLDSAGNPVPGKRVTLSADGRTFGTVTGPSGRYRFYGAPAGQGTVTANRQEFTVVVGPNAPSSVLRLAAVP